MLMRPDAFGSGRSNPRSRTHRTRRLSVASSRRWALAAALADVALPGATGEVRTLGWVLTEMPAAEDEAPEEAPHAASPKQASETSSSVTAAAPWFVTEPRQALICDV